MSGGIHRRKRWVPVEGERKGVENQRRLPGGGGVWAEWALKTEICRYKDGGGIRQALFLLWGIALCSSQKQDLRHQRKQQRGQGVLGPEPRHLQKHHLCYIFPTPLFWVICLLIIFQTSCQAFGVGSFVTFHIKSIHTFTMWHQTFPCTPHTPNLLSSTCVTVVKPKATGLGGGPAPAQLCRCLDLFFFPPSILEIKPRGT